MNSDEYRKQLEKWAAGQKEHNELAQEQPYKPGKMPVRAPLGCMLIAAAFVFVVIYVIGAAAGFWKWFLF